MRVLGFVLAERAERVLGFILAELAQRLFGVCGKAKQL
jgi:hypothetical protein